MTEQADIFGKVAFSKGDEALVQLYAEVGRTVDHLAYTDEFEKLYQGFQKAGFHWDRAEVFRRLLLLRKAGLLPRLYQTVPRVEHEGKTATG